MLKMMNKSVLHDSRYLPALKLQEISLIKIVSTLCNNQELLGLILQCNIQKDLTGRLCLKKGKEWRAVQIMANEMISQICNRVIFKKRLLEFLCPASYRIILWKYKYASCISNAYLQQFCFTYRGRIDNKRTARYIIRNKNISVRKRFIMACFACLDSEIPKIWAEMSDADKANLYADYPPNRIFPLIRFWIRTLEGSDNVIEHCLGGAIQCASDIGLLEAVKYLLAITPDGIKVFMQRLCMDELHSKLGFSILLDEDQSDIGYFCFVQMPDEVQDGVFKSFTTTVLSLLLHSSRRKLCFDLIKERILSASDYDIARVLGIIFYSYHFEVVNNGDCRQLFIDIWRLIPISKRNTRLVRYLRTEILTVLIRDDFPFLLEKGAFKKIANLTSLETKYNTYDQVDFNEDKWNFLNFVIEELITILLIRTKKDTILHWLGKRKSNQSVWKRILRFVRETRIKNLKLKNGNNYEIVPGF